MIKCEDDNNLSSKIDSRSDQAAIIELQGSVHRCFTNCYVERERNYRYVNENECHVNNHIFLFVEPGVHVCTVNGCRLNNHFVCKAGNRE